MTGNWLENHGIPWCFREECGDLLESGKAFVINLDDSDGGGTHWTAARRIGGTVFYADPFGLILGGYPPEELRDWKVVANRIAFQHPSTNYCGYYAARFAIVLEKFRGKTQKDLEAALMSSLP